MCRKPKESKAKNPWLWFHTPNISSVREAQLQQQYIHCKTITPLVSGIGFQQHIGKRSLSFCFTVGFVQVSANKRKQHTHRQVRVKQQILLFLYYLFLNSLPHPLNIFIDVFKSRNKTKYNSQSASPIPYGSLSPFHRWIFGFLSHKTKLFPFCHAENPSPFYEQEKN